MPIIETEQLYLRLLTLDDFDDLYALFRDPAVMRYVGAGVPLSREESETTFLSIIKHWERHGFGRLAAIDKRTHRFVGFGGLRSLIGTPEVVYHLAASQWGRGLATEIAKASLRYGFEQHNFERIVAIAKPENRASFHVMEKVGMKYEKHTDYYGMDVVQYAISRNEYQPDASFYLLHSF